MASSSQSSLSIKRIVFGVRYQPQWRVADHLGEVVDRILRRSDEFFNAGALPLSDSTNNQHRLWNAQTIQEVILNERDAVLNFRLASPDATTVNSIAEAFDDEILGALRGTCKLTDIVRYGFLTEFQECGELLGILPTQRYLNDDFPNARSLNMQLSQRLATPEGHSKKGVDDFRNINYVINQDDNGAVKIALDYQRHFEPALNAKQFGERAFSEFVSQGLAYQQKSFAEWIGKLLRESEAA